MEKECIISNLQNQLFKMERSGSVVKVADGMVANIPEDMSMFSVFAINDFVSSGEYREDGYVYVGEKLIKKWYKNVEDVLVWFPILKDIKKLQCRYLKVLDEYRGYLNTEYHFAFKELVKVKKAHAIITHKYKGSCDPWWFYQTDKYEGHEGISWDWIDKPDNPINLDIGNLYYRTEKRLQQLGGRVYRFRKVLEYAISDRILRVEGELGQILQFKVGDRIYWFNRSKYSWEKLAFPEDDVKVVEV
jgi:hypothetical protein